ncbi:MAG: hypothetical protein EPN57_10460 [Paraburkholderia sp.]|nr:MAG: hypothetical protein EPN57_10460 [Paraburkholderia sp.]
MARTQELASRLLQARRTHTLVDPESLASCIPQSADEALVVQQLVLDELGGCAGYKIGAGSPTAVPQFAPLPATRVFGAATGLRRGDYARLGLELEIAFSFASDVDRSLAERPEAVIDAIDTMSVVVEAVDSRFEGWPNVDPLLQLADLQNNGALVIGDTRPYDCHFDFSAPQLGFYWNDHEIFQGAAKHSAGDPRRLVAWLVAHMLETGQSIPARTMLTTGSYTPFYIASGPGIVRGTVEGFGKIEFEVK